jgi:hypothetical protein
VVPVGGGRLFHVAALSGFDHLNHGATVFEAGSHNNGQITALAGSRIGDDENALGSGLCRHLSIVNCHRPAI